MSRSEVPPAVRVEANGLSFSVVDAGSGPGILLLHGFPDSSYVWRNQIAPLTGAGFRVVAPDLRGFGESDRPEGVGAYAMGELLGDVRGILRALGLPRVHVVGHDWGALLAWMFAITKPERVDRLVAISVGHPGNFAPRSMRQMQLSWYILLFQFPGLAEELIPRDDWRFLKGWAGGTGDLDRYARDLGRPGALTAALNWYRANDDPMRMLEPPPTFPKIETPVLGIWGAKDAALTEESMADSAKYLGGSWRYERFDDAGHWVQLEHPDRLNALLIEFLSTDADGEAADPRKVLAKHHAGLAERLRQVRRGEPG